MDTYFHGEVLITKISKLPEGLKKVSAKDMKWIVADSENTGNHHCVKEADGVELYEKDGVLYMQNESPAEVFCVDTARHDTEIIPPGIWEINRANEHDYLSDMTRKVAD